MKICKKFTLALFTVLCSVLLFTLPVMSAKNTQPKKLGYFEFSPSNIKINKTKLKPGQKLKISMKLNGKGHSKIKKTVVFYRSSRGQRLELELKHNSKKNRWSGQFKIPKGMQKGIWRVSYIGIYAALDDEPEYEIFNSHIFYPPDTSEYTDLRKLNLKISGTKADYSAPKFDYNSFSLSSEVNTAKGGGNITFKAKIIDKSPIKSVLAVFCKTSDVMRDDNEQPQPFVWRKDIVLEYNKNTKLYEGTGRLPKGSYFLYYIQAQDVFGNMRTCHDKRYYYDNSGLILSKLERDFSKFDVSFD